MVQRYCTLTSQELFNLVVLELLLTVDLGREQGPLILEPFKDFPLEHLEEVECCAIISFEARSSRVEEF